MAQLSTSHVFMSYSRRDETVMRRVVAFLRKQGIKVWVDNEKLIPGTPIWETEIEKAIKGADAIVVVLSPDAADSEWVRREISFADQYHKRIFPVLARGDQDTSITIRLITRQYVDIRDNEDIGMNSLSSALLFYLEELETQKQKEREAEKRLAQIQGQRDAAEQEVARQKAEREAAEWSAFQAVERAAHEKAEREIAEREAARQKAKREAAELKVAQLKAKLGELLILAKREWSVVVNSLQAITKKKFKIHPAIVSALILSVVVIGFLIYKQANSITLFFSGTTAEGINVYSYDGKNVTIVTQTTGGIQNWSPTDDLLGHVFLTSNLDGKAEIYELKNNGELRRMTNTLDKAESWSPTSDPFGQLYFTSNRDGKAEIYRIKNNGQPERVTTTPSQAESWSPAIDPFGRLYFTSNRDGKAEIYRIKNNGQPERVTTTPSQAESWSPAIDPFGQLYFTSNRDGKAEIYRIKNNGQPERVTTTPDPAESWSPVIRGQNIYFTSNREGYNRVYVLNPQALAISTFVSWTTTSSAESSPSTTP